MRRRRRPPRWTALAAGLALTAAGCFGDGSSEPTDTVSPTAPDPLGTITIPPGAPIEVAAPLNRSPMPGSSAGQDAKRGAQLALDFLDGVLDDRPGQLLGHPVRLIDTPGGCSPKNAEPLAGEVAVVGAIGPGCALAMDHEPVSSLTEAGVVVISPLVTEAALTDVVDPARSFFRTAYNDRLEGTAAADFGLDQLQATRAAIAYVEEGAAGAAASFRARFVDGGGFVTVSTTLSDKPEELDRLLRAIALGRPEVVYLVARGSVCAEAATRSLSIPGLSGIPIVASVGCFDPAFTARFDLSSGTTFVAGPDLNGFQEDDFYRTEFLPAYRDQFGTAPVGVFHTQAYDATLILLDAIDRVASQAEDGTLTIGRTALREAVAGTDGVAGLSGTISCAESGDCVPAGTIAIYQVPDVPLAGGSTDAEPVFTETIALADLEP